MKIICLSGSARAQSRSTALLRIVKQQYTEHDFIIADICELPFFDDTVPAAQRSMIENLKMEIDSADGIVICTPEYNHSVPAVLKNAIDWCSRPAFESVLKHKPVTIITQAQSPFGGVRAQGQLKIIMSSTLSILHPCHEMAVGGIHHVMDESLQHVDEVLVRRLVRHIDDFLRFIKKEKEQ